jgi:membrane AbrB-like protein
MASEAADDTLPRPSVRKLTRRDLPIFLRTIAIGVAGGALFDALNLPLPWMLGSMAAIGATTLGRIETSMDSRLRTGMIVILGLLLGSAFSPEILERAALWSISLAALVVYVIVCTAAIYTYYRLAAGFDYKTAFFAGVPGGLNEMIALTLATGGDDRQVSVAHTTRIFLVVMTLPFMFRIFEGFEPGLRSFAGSSAALTPADIAIFAACAVVGYYGARLIRMPAPHLTGPMAMSASVHLLGITSAAPPPELVAAAQVFLGTAVGARLAGLTYRDMGRILRLGGVATAILLMITCAFALTLNAVTGLPFSSLVLAFSPGGLTEMTLVALGLGYDIAFVATHHIARITIVVMLMPVLFRLVARRAGDDET